MKADFFIFNDLPDSAFIGAETLRQLLGVRGSATLWRWGKSGRIPKSTRPKGSKTRAWNVGELRRFAAEALMTNQAQECRMPKGGNDAHRSTKGNGPTKPARVHYC